MPRTVSATLPLDPLLVASGAVHTERQRTFEPAPMTALAAIVGLDRRTLHRWAREGVPLYSADAVAAACGLHPHDVWGPEWFAASHRQDQVERVAS